MEESNDKKSFVFYLNWLDDFNTLEKAEFYDLLIAVRDHLDGKEVTFEDRTMRTAWNFLRSQIDRDMTKYENKKARIRELRSRAGKASAAARSGKTETNEDGDDMGEVCSGADKTNTSEHMLTRVDKTNTSEQERTHADETNTSEHMLTHVDKTNNVNVNVNENVNGNVNVNDNVNVIQDTNVSVNNNINTPLTPLRGGTRIFGQKPASTGKSSKRVTLVTMGRGVFEKYYSELTNDVYYWQAKDAKAMKSLLAKVKYSRESRADPLPCDDDSLLSALDIFLRCISDPWVLKNFSVTVIDSKFNEIKSQLVQKTHERNNPSAFGSTTKSDLFNQAATLANDVRAIDEEWERRRRAET